MSIIRWQRDCFVVPPRSDVIARTRNEEEAISKPHYIYDMTPDTSTRMIVKPWKDSVK